MLTDLQKELIETTKQLEKQNEETKQTYEKLESLLKQVGVGSSFQDPTDGVVFEVVVPSGTFVSFKTIGYARTKRNGERAGSLSMTRAKELGFNV